MYQGSGTECILTDLFVVQNAKLIVIDFRMHEDDEKLLVWLPQLALNSASSYLQYKYSQKLFQLATIGSRTLVQYEHSEAACCCWWSCEAWAWAVWWGWRWCWGLGLLGC